MSIAAIIILSVALGFCIGGLFTLFLYKDYFGYYSEYREPIELEEAHEVKNHIMEPKCKNCKYHDSFSWVCVNADSSYVADFTDDEDWCSAYEEDETEKELQS